ncbi:hypothetical protein SAMN06297422_1278 [Lachnospiraceae bacterium]|nr:hypothetical protein SAMN06297422_1278 [Lachnospiraceae bacterium]
MFYNEEYKEGNSNVQTGYWSYTALEKQKKEKEAKKNEVVA